MTAYVTAVSREFVFSRETDVYLPAIPEFVIAERAAPKETRDDFDVEKNKMKLLEMEDHIRKIKIVTNKMLSKDSKRTMDVYGVDQVKNPPRFKCCVIL